MLLFGSASAELDEVFENSQALEEVFKTTLSQAGLPDLNAQEVRVPDFGIKVYF
jgi:hypothetical protein